MALDATTLGNEIYNVRLYFANKTLAQLTTEFGSLEAVRQEICKREANAIIEHFKANAEGRYQTGSLTAGNVPVTATTAINVKIF